MIMMGKSIRQIWVKVIPGNVSTFDPIRCPQYLHIHVCYFNPYLTNGFSHHYQLDESTFIFRNVRSDF